MREGSFPVNMAIGWLTVLVCAAALASGFELIPYRSPKEYVINLDLPAEQRWVEVLSDFPHAALVANNFIKNLLPPQYVQIVKQAVARLSQHIPAEFSREIDGVASYLSIDKEDIVTINLLYELTIACTSIIAQDSGGNIWHGRNFDYYVQPSLLRQYSVDLHFQRNGQTVYTGTTFVGYVGLFTGQKPNVFTVSVDARENRAGNMMSSILTALQSQNPSFIGFMVRQALESETSFTGAVTKLSAPVTISSVYFILGGTNPGEGAVITKGRQAVMDTWYLAPEQGRWYLVETNYDHWEPAGDGRREGSITSMEAVGQDAINATTMLKVMSTPPQFHYYTLYTNIMSAARPELYTTYIWEFL